MICFVRYNAQERGSLFIGAGVQVYEGMIVGQSPKAGDIAVNVRSEERRVGKECGS